MTAAVTLNYIQFASFGRPHGLKGGFFLKTSDRRKVWDGYKSLLVETQNGFVEKKVTKHYLSGEALVLELEGLNSRTEVEALYDKKIYVHKDFVVVNKDEYLVNDLINFSVISTSATNEKIIIGQVVGVISYGAQENLEIKLHNSNVVLYPEAV